MPNSELHDLIATVPSCMQTTQLKVVLEILQQTQCDRLVVVNEQQFPLGVVFATRLMSQLIRDYQAGEAHLEMQNQIGNAQALIEPIVILPAQLSIEQFRLHLARLQTSENISNEWAIVDTQQKFCGLLDRTKLLAALASNQHRSEPIQTASRHLVLDVLLELLERLPCPLTLQTATGEVVMQNSAWEQHFGTMSHPEAIQRKVVDMLAAGNSIDRASPEDDRNLRATSPYLQPQMYAHNANISPMLSAIRDRTVTTSDPEYDTAYPPAASYCQLGTHANTCVCIWSLPNGEEQVWEFVKVPLQAEIQSNVPAAVTAPLCLLLATDVTEQQQLALELAAKNADLIQLNRLKDEFLSCISHELKTPLTAVLGLSTLLKDQALGELNERQSRYARLIHQSGRHLMSVVNDILDLTRMETGQLKLTCELVQIRNVCDRALTQAKASQPDTNQTTTLEEVLAEGTLEHRFTLEIEPELETLVADELRLRQMLVHLLANALKFTETDREIGLRVSRWEGWIAFTVWDTGIGIPEQKQHLIFQKFQQLENPLTRRFKGAGLGLVLARALARLHGGDVSFLSKEGKGSSFTLLLPPHPPTDFRLAISDVELQSNGALASHVQPSDDLLDSVSLRRQLSSNRNPQSPNRLVLLVEAAPRYIAEITEQLTSLGYRVVNARSGTEALEKARRLQPGIIFLNPLLPLLSGWDVLTLLKSDKTTRQIPAIITATRAEKERAIANRADEFISLPVQLEVLAEILTRFCGEVPPTAPSEAQTAASNTSSNSITILRLVGGESTPLIPPPAAMNYRILEADDLEQAELLTHIWQPNVLLLDRAIAKPELYLKQLSQSSRLAALPIVTLDAAITQIANRIKGLTVFPCLLPPEKRDTDTLLAVLRFAAGTRWKPNILVVDATTHPDGSSHTNEWFQALIPYLETAGFKGAIAHSWSEVLQQIHQQSVDLILICCGSQLAAGAVQALQTLEREQLPPILVVNRLFDADKAKHLHHQLDIERDKIVPTMAIDFNAVQVDTAIRAIATEILPPSLSMQELLDKILKTLAMNAKRD